MSLQLVSTSLQLYFMQLITFKQLIIHLKIEVKFKTNRPTQK